MKVFLNEISTEEQQFHFTQEDTWIREVILHVSERPQNSDVSPHGTDSPSSTDVSLSIRKVDEVYVIDGKANTAIQLICSRCAELFNYPCHLRFSALFCKDPTLAGIAHLQKTGYGQKASGRPTGKNHGFARHAHDFSQDPSEDPTHIEGKDIDITYLNQEYIDLSAVMSEQLQLQVPFQPLCQEKCHGICSQCGTDLNVQPCACHSSAQAPLLSSLRDFKI